MSSHDVFVPIRTLSGKVHSCQSHLNLSRKPFQVQNAQATIFFWHAASFPVYFALSSRECRVTRPKEFFPCSVDLLEDIIGRFQDN